MINEVHSMVTQRQLSKWNPGCVGCGFNGFTSNGSNGFTLNGSNGFTTNGSNGCSLNGSNCFTSDEANDFTTGKDVKVQRGNFSSSNSSHKPARTIQQLSSLCRSSFSPNPVSSLSLTGSRLELGQDFTLLHKYDHVPKLTCDHCCFTSRVGYTTEFITVLFRYLSHWTKFLAEIWFMLVCGEQISGNIYMLYDIINVWFPDYVT